MAISNKKPHKPYRQSKLTHLLKDSLGGNSKTILIANIYGEKAHIEETVSTLQFAARMRSVTNTAKVNESDDPALLLKRYERQLKVRRRSGSRARADAPSCQMHARAQLRPPPPLPIAGRGRVHRPPPHSHSMQLRTPSLASAS